MQTHGNIGAIVKRNREEGNNNLQESRQFKKYFPKYVGIGGETSARSGECGGLGSNSRPRNIPRIECGKSMDSISVLGPIQPVAHISYDSTPSSARRGQKRGCNLNMHNIPSNKSVKREPLELHKRGLPVAWGRDIITKCPRLV